MFFSLMPAAVFQLTDWASIAAIAAAFGTFAGLPFIAMQLHSGNRERHAQVRALRTQATMLFQERFKESQGARRLLFQNFRIHASLATTIDQLRPDGEPHTGIDTWEEIDDLSEDEKDQADEVIRALNDVAQYVVDGLELRSALQQYHLVILRVGALLNPYLAQKNAEVEGRRALRWGRRVPILYNAALAYHRCNPKHREREVAINRRVKDDGSELRLTFIDGSGSGVRQFECFADTPHESLLLPDDELSRVISAAEAMLRR